MDHLTSCSGNLLSTSIQREETGNRQIRVELLSLSYKNKRFSSTAVHTFGPCSENVEIIKVQDVLELKTGLSVVAILTEKIDHVSKKYTYDLSMLNSVGRSVPVTKFSIVCKLKLSDFKLIDGPCIIWKTNSIFSIASAFYSGIINDAAMAFDDIFYIGYCSAFDNVVVIAYGGKPDGTNGLTVKTYILELCAESSVFKQSNDIKCLFPTDFSNIKTLIVDNAHADVCSSRSKERHKIISYAVTQQGHIIKFNCDKVESAVNSEINGSRGSKLYKWNSFGFDKEFLAHLNNQDLCVIDLETMQIVLKLRDVHAVLLDDFLHCGCNQLLIIEREINLETQWTLSEYGTLQDCGVTDTRKDEISQNIQQNVRSAVEALTSRLQGDLILLNEEKKEVTEERQQFISDTWHRLTCISEGIKLAPYVTPVASVPLLEDDDNWSHCVPTEADPEHEKLSICGELWQRIVGNEWVVGARIRNTAPKSIFSPVLCPVHTSPSEISSNAQHTVYSKSMYKLTSPQTDTQSQDPSTVGTHNETSVKRRKLMDKYSDAKQAELPPSSQVNLVAVTKVPKFSASKNITFDVILKWRKDNEDNPKTWKSMNCGSIALSVTDIISRKYHVDLGGASANAVKSPKDVEIDLEALSAVQFSTSLTLKSAWSDLGMVPHWLRTRAGFLLHPLYKAYVTRDPNPLSGVRIGDFQYDKAASARVTVHTHDEDQLYLLIQHLYHSFPDDIVILPAGNSNIAKYQKEALSAMTSELRYVTGSTNQPGNTTPYDDDTLMFPEKGESGKINVQNVRANFAKRKRSLSPSTDSVDSNGAISVKEERSRLEFVTDSSVVLLQSNIDFI